MVLSHCLPKVAIVIAGFLNASVVIRESRIKVNNATMQDRHRQKMGMTKKALEDLTVANDYDQIFSDYFNKFIMNSWQSTWGQIVPR